MLESATTFEFATAWVWWLLPLPVLVYYWASAYRAHAESVQIVTLADLAPASKLKVSGGGGSHKLAYGLVALLWLCLLCTAARPERILVKEQKEVPVRDILLVLDISGSMAIRDMQGEDGTPGGASRMEIMQKAVSEFIGKRNYDNIGLIVFGSQAVPLSPVSEDHAALLEQVKQMVPGMAGSQTSIGDAIGVAIRTYRGMESDAGPAQAGNERMMILLTDGLDTSSVLPPRVALRLAEKQQVLIHSIAFGDVSDEDSSSTIDTQLLKDIAGQTGGSFHQASESLASLQKVYDAIDQLAPRKVKWVAVTERQPLLTYPLLLAGALAVALLMLSLRGRRQDD